MNEILLSASFQIIQSLTKNPYGDCDQYMNPVFLKWNLQKCLFHEHAIPENIKWNLEELIFNLTK